MKSTLLIAAALTPLLSAETALTIYNRDLAVIRETVPLKLRAGETFVSFDRATARVQPDSVVLRDPAGKADFSILEQGYRNDPVNRWLLLNHFEGQTIDFRTTYPDGRVEKVRGKIIRSGFVPGGQSQEPIIEVDGKFRFQLPGEPLFPTLGDGSILRPTLSWQIAAAEPAEFDAQLSYLSNGFRWEADYNLVAPEKGETVTMTGWITIGNHSGTVFNDAKVKLVAGDVNIMQPDPTVRRAMMEMARADQAGAGHVEEKAFDDFHLYTLPRQLTIRDKETKQVEFIRAPEVKASKAYIYDPVNMRYHGGRSTNPIQGQKFSKDVAIFWEFTNNEESGLGMPLPAGRVRFYRADDADGNLEFVGENNIDHTPRNEELSIYTGNAFDLVGERTITNFERKDRESWMRETIEVVVKNRSKEPKTILVREHLWRWSNWEIRDASMEFEKKDAQTIEFKVPLKPDEERKITFKAHYTW
ncbi:DUF4139 domain-containing protein [Haloferula helveola]|uniref:DUF4139 domain-containing protein n=1 Tax=Haloferula helveola TaxID=490095 RepID=A0ABM7RFI4_9BACT|nr:DUF4139 domain-containing protein [Haloferula helveola]